MFSSAQYAESVRSLSSICSLALQYLASESNMVCELRTKCLLCIAVNLCCPVLYLVSATVVRCGFRNAGGKRNDGDDSFY